MHKERRKVKEIIRKYKKILLFLGIRVERVILYGSYNKGNQREDSDIDLAVISDDFRGMNLRERLEILGRAAARIMEPVEARGYTPRELKLTPPGSFLGEILTTGIMI